MGELSTVFCLSLSAYIPVTHFLPRPCSRFFGASVCPDVGKPRRQHFAAAFGGLRGSMATSLLLLPSFTSPLAFLSVTAPPAAYTNL
jgi:hypothetical protein